MIKTSNLQGTYVEVILPSSLFCQTSFRKVRVRNSLRAQVPMRVPTVVSIVVYMAVLILK